MKAIAIIQARLDSTRFPRKVLEEIDGIPLVGHTLRRVSMIQGLDGAVLTVPFDQGEIFRRIADPIGVDVVEGPHPDVLLAFAGIVETRKPEIVFRFTADCWAICPEVSEAVLDLFNERNADYAANINPPTTWPEGLDTEIFRGRLLLEASRDAKAEYDRHHVTPLIRARAEKSGAATYLMDAPDGFHNVKLSIDVPKDLEVARRVYSRLSVGWGFNDLARALTKEGLA